MSKLYAMDQISMVKKFFHGATYEVTYKRKKHMCRLIKLCTDRFNMLDLATDTLLFRQHLAAVTDGSHKLSAAEVGVAHWLTVPANTDFIQVRDGSPKVSVIRLSHRNLIGPMSIQSKDHDNMEILCELLNSNLGVGSASLFSQIRKP
jgi:hypothetical protein